MMTSQLTPAKKILICDDEESIVEIMNIVLSEKGYQIKTLSDAQDIFKVIERWKPDLIFIDLWMPEISGDEVVRELKRNKKTAHIPVIIVTANKDSQKIANAVNANDYISKPFDIIELENMAEKYL